jgi:hypothetical protein
MRAAMQRTSGLCAGLVDAVEEEVGVGHVVLVLLARARDNVVDGVVVMEIKSRMRFKASSSSTDDG